MPDEKQLELAIQYSLHRNEDDAFWGNIIPLDTSYGNYATPLPSLENPIRQVVLKYVDEHPQNALWAGAVARTIHKITGTSAEIKGKRRVGWYQDVIFFNSALGDGFTAFIEQALRDYLRYDVGAVVELIGRGPSDGYLPKEAITGIATLDPLKCHFSSNREYPVYFEDEAGVLHRLHWSRVVRLVDQRKTNQGLRGGGECALSRAMSFVQQSIVNQVFLGESLLDDLPSGYLTVNGVNIVQWNEKKRTFDAERKMKHRLPKSAVMEIISPDSQNPATINFLPLSRVPEGYDPVKLTELHARGIALALDIDPNDVMPLSGGTFGNNTQAKILDQKNREGGITHFLAVFERMFNTRVLPDPLTFEWKYRDDEQSQLAADIAAKHIANARALVDMALTAGADRQKALELGNRYLIDTVGTVADILTDPNGEIISLYSDDPEPEQNPQTVVIVDDIGSEETPPAGQAVQIGQAETPIVPASKQHIGRKDWEGIKATFVDEFTGVISAANKGDIDNRRRAGLLLRAQLSKHGRKAMLEGLADGGVEVDALEGDDLKLYNTWVKEQTTYVSNLTATIYKSGLTEGQIRARVDAWANKSIQSIYLAGLISGDRNGLYGWKYGDTVDHCSDCERFAKGHFHRMKDWESRGYFPGSSKLDCEGWQCDCKFFKAPKGQSAAGRF